MKVTIDRFDGDFAVVELPNRKTVNLPRILVPRAKEGDIVNIEVDKSETEKRKKSIEKLMGQVFE